MARKKLLTEGEIRQFMKLANLRPIGKERIDELYPGARDDEMGDEMDLAGEMDAPEPAPVEDEAPPVDDELPPMDAEGPGPEVDEELAQELAQGFADVMADVLGVAVEVEGDAAPIEDEMGGMEAEVDVAAPEGGEEAGAALDDLDAMEDEDEDPVGMRDNMYENQDKIVAEVAKRVAARLQRESRKEQMVDQLAERIMKRLTNK